jgi:hypothetical protein
MAQVAWLGSVLGMAVAALACGASVEFESSEGGTAGAAAQAASGTGNTGAIGAAGTGGTGAYAGTGGTGAYAGTGGTGAYAGTGGTGGVAGTGGTGGTGSCSPPLQQCGYYCVDTNWDPAHCGGCFQPCDAGETCTWGHCQCPNGVCGSCNFTVLSSATPQSVSGTTWGASDYVAAPCGAEGSPDVGFLFSPVDEGSYVFDTVGSSYDTVLMAYDAVSCTLLGCNDDYQNATSRIETTLAEGQTVLVVVDGFGGSGGPFVLNISHEAPPVTCPVLDLGSSVPAVVSGSTSNQPNDAQGSCGGAQAPELSYRFTAPVSGSYLFTTVGSSYDTLLHVRADGCNGPELGCDDDGAGNLMSRIMLPLAAGQTVVVFVDGFGTSSGAFVLRVQTI